MSNFIRITKHPITGEFEEACWLDLGREYRVEFRDGSSFPEDEIQEFGVKY